MAANRNKAISTGDRPVAGMMLAIAGGLMLPCMDAVAKYLGETGAMSPGQLTFFRFAIQTVFSAICLTAIGGFGALRSNRFGINFVRGVLIGTASLFFFIAIKYMPLADAIAVFFVGPLVLIVLSVIVLRETVGWRRIGAVLAGFGGALIVVQPSFVVFGWVALMPLATAVLFATYMLLNRIAGPSDKAMVMQFVSGLGGMAAVAVAMIVAVPLNVPDLAVTVTGDVRAWMFVLSMGAFGIAGHHLLVMAYQRAPASLLAPFQYIEIATATVLGLLVFGDFPDPVKWFGIGIIIASGLFVFWREQRAAKA